MQHPTLQANLHAVPQRRKKTSRLINHPCQAGQRGGRGMRRRRPAAPQQDGAELAGRWHGAQGATMVRPVQRPAGQWAQWVGGLASHAVSLRTGALDVALGRCSSQFRHRRHPSRRDLTEGSTHSDLPRERKAATPVIPAVCTARGCEAQIGRIKGTMTARGREGWKGGAVCPPVPVTVSEGETPPLEFARCVSVRVKR